MRVFDAKTGEHLQDIGKRGGGPGEFNLPRDLAIGAQGRLYVVDGGNFRVVVFDRESRCLSSFGSVGKQHGQFARPNEIAVDPQGNVYVIETAFGNFKSGARAATLPGTSVDRYGRCCAGFSGSSGA